MTPRIRRALMVALTALSAAALIAGAALSATRAAAVLQHVVETGQPGMLSLRAAPAAPYWRDVRPGDTLHWPIEASLSDAPVGTLSLELRAAGDLVTDGGMTASVATCSAPFEVSGRAEAACAATAVTVLPETRLVDIAGTGSGNRFELADLHHGQPRHLLVTLRLPASADPDAVDHASATVGVGLHAAGESPPPGGSPEPDASGRLPVTGADISAIGLLGAGLVGLGATLAVRRRTREQS